MGRFPFSSRTSISSCVGKTRRLSRKGTSISAVCVGPASAALAWAILIERAHGATSYPADETQSTSGNRPVPPMDLAYDAPPPCPSRESFLERIRAHDMQRSKAFPSAEAHLSVIVSTAHDEYRGLITAYDGARPILVRSVTDRSCDEVVNALSFIAVLAFDGPEPPKGVALEMPRDRPADLVSANRDEGDRWSIRAGARTELASWIEPDLSLGISAFLELERSGDGPWAPSARLYVDHTFKSSATRPEGAAHFYWNLLQFELCPIRWGSAWVIQVRPCVRMDAGLVSARGEVIGDSRNATRAWASASLLGRVSGRVVGPLELELSGGVSIPLVRDIFFFQPDTQVYRAGAIAAIADLGLAVRIW